MVIISIVAVLYAQFLPHISSKMRLRTNIIVNSYVYKDQTWSFEPKCFNRELVK